MSARDFFDEPQAQPPAETPRREPRPREASAPQPAPAPRAPAAPVAPAVVFHAVSEHDAVVEEAHKPVRRRRQEHEAPQQAEISLQLVETQAEAATPPPAEDEPPRRTRPRRRRHAESASEPLMLVETQPGAETARPDGQP